MGLKVQEGSIETMRRTNLWSKVYVSSSQALLPRVCLTKFLATVSFISLSWIITKVVAMRVKHEAVYLAHSWW